MKLESKMTKGVGIRNARYNTNGFPDWFTGRNGCGVGRKTKEKPEHGKVLAIFVVAMLLLSVVAVLTWQSTSASVIKINAGPKMEIKYTPRWPIYIKGNANFTSANGVIGGSGTQNDPYIIAGWEIDANGGPYGIWIENTDAYFVIRNCNVYGATGSGSAPYGAGIALNNVTHGTLDSNKCDNSNFGIYLYGGSQYNTITNNNASGNSYYGIYLYSSSNNNITNNNASGISLVSSSNNNITNNNASGTYYGVYLDSSSNNNITNNNASGNSDCGIYLWHSSNNNITNNNASGNSRYGIHLYDSSNNTITNNTASGNSEAGIYLGDSGNNTITNNNASGNSGGDYGYGIYLRHSSNNTITNNAASGNSGWYFGLGIYLWYSSNNTITNNNASGNGGGRSSSGILLSSSSNNSITNNTASGNSYNGIYLSSSSDNIIIYNWVCNNAYYGVYITSSSRGNTIHHNNFIGNGATALRYLSQGASTDTPNGAGRGVNGNCQAYDDVGGNSWYDTTTQEGNYWSNWDGQGWGTANAYPIAGGAGASDWYPLGNPVAEFNSMPLFVLALASLLILARVRKPHKHS